MPIVMCRFLATTSNLFTLRLASRNVKVSSLLKVAFRLAKVENKRHSLGYTLCLKCAVFGQSKTQVLLSFSVCFVCFSAEKNSKGCPHNCVKEKVENLKCLVDKHFKKHNITNLLQVQFVLDLLVVLIPSQTLDLGASQHLDRSCIVCIVLEKNTSS